MTETSRFWTTNGTGDGPSGGYTQQQFYDFLRRVFLKDDEASEGVMKNVLNDLAVTSPSATNIDVATGAAIVYGFFYENSAVLNLSFSAPAATTGGRVVLQVDWTAQTVRAVVNLNSSGVTTPPALTQSAGTTWEISLATFLSDNAGNVSSLVNTDDYANFGTMVNTEMIEDANVTLAKMAANSVDTSQLVADSVTNAKIDAGAVDTTELAALAVTTAKIENSNVTLAKMAANSVDSDQYVDGSIDTVHIGNLQVTTAKIAADAIDGTKIANDAIDSEHYVDGSIDTAHIANEAVTAAKIDNRIRKMSLSYSARTGAEPDVGSTEGVEYSAALDEYIVGQFQVPTDYASGGKIVMIGNPQTSSNDFELLMQAFYQAVGETSGTHTASAGSQVVLAGTASVDKEYVSLTLTSLAAGDSVNWLFGRLGLSASDTNTGVLWQTSIYFEYTADS